MTTLEHWQRYFERAALKALADMSTEAERAAYMRGWNDALQSEESLQRVRLSDCGDMQVHAMRFAAVGGHSKYVRCGCGALIGVSAAGAVACANGHVWESQS